MDSCMIETIDRVTDFYSELNQMILQFQLKSGLRCPVSCRGVCCLKEDVYTTVTEMLPVAHSVLLNGESRYWIEQLESMPPVSRCVFYSENVHENSQGHCCQYNLRPTICRMFGFASTRNKRGELKLSTCKIIKQEDPDSYRFATEIQTEAPCFSNVSSMLYGLKPSIDARLLPINEALKSALTRVGLYLQMSHGEDMGGISVA